MHLAYVQKLFEVKELEYWRPTALGYLALLLQDGVRATHAISRSPQCSGGNELIHQKRSPLAEQVSQNHGDGIATPTNANPVHVTTTMKDETVSEELITMAPVETDADIWQSVTVPGMETVKELLEKPSILANTLFQSTDSSVFYSAELPQLLLQKVKNSARLNGITYFRADMEIEIKVNATRFQQGRYIIGWLPYGATTTTGVASTYGVNYWQRAHLANLMTVTSTPHVEIDLATQSSAKLNIPFTSHVNFISTRSTQVHSLGLLFMYPYSALQAGSGDTIAQVAIWGRFTNIHLSGNAILQSAIGSVEAKKAKIGPISDTMIKIQRTGGVLSKIPFLATAAATVGWAAGIMGDAAKIWGYSKPTAVAPPTPMVRKAIINMANVDGSFTGKKMAAYTDNAVQISGSRSRTQLDEMSFQFLYSVPVWFKTISWSQVQSAGTTLSFFEVHPDAFKLTMGKGFTEPPFATIAHNFRIWRGTLVFKFKFVKTEFHSGRLQFSFVPYDQDNAQIVAPTIEQTDNVVRQIIDIRETNEVEYCVPFIAPTNYVEADIPIGRLYVTVINELVAPDTVASTIPILCEISAGDDLDFGFPTGDSGDQLQPYIPAIIQTNVRQLECEELGAGHISTIGLVESTGEKIISLRSLFKRAMNNAKITAAGQRILAYPFSIGPVVQLTDNTTALIRSGAGSVAYNGDILDVWSMFYLFSSGSMRVYYQNDNPSAVYGTALTTLEVIPNNTSPVATDNAVLAVYQRPVEFNVGAIDGMYAFEVPSYIVGGVRNNIAEMCSPNITSGGRSFYSGLAPVGLSITIPSSAANLNTGLIYRSAGDDHNLSRFCGITPLVYSSVA